MRNINLRRQVNLSQAECHNLANQLLDKLVSKFGGSYAPEGSRYKYRHNMGVKAIVEPKEGELSVDVSLGIMAKSFAPQLEQEMNRALDEHLNL